MSDRMILVRQSSTDSWSEPETSTYTNESHLQELLAADPTRIPGIPKGSKAVRELLTSAGPIDICVVSPSGAITVVECKLNKNPESRRMVIGQVIDYASALKSSGFPSFRQGWLARDGDDLDQIVEGGDLGLLEQNIESGNIDLCLAVDQIDDDLKRMVLYLSAITSDEVSVSAIQLTYARHGDLEILVPSSYGIEMAQAKVHKHAASKECWTWETFTSELSHPDDLQCANELKRRLDETRSTGSHTKLWFGVRPKGGIFFHIFGERYAPLQLNITAAGRLVISGTWAWWPSLKNEEGFADLARFLGQNHLESKKRVLASDLSLPELWKVASDCDQRINLPLE